MEAIEIIQRFVAVSVLFVAATLIIDIASSIIFFVVGTVVGTTKDKLCKLSKE